MKRKLQVPGATAAQAEPEAPKVQHPAIERAMADATKMSHEEAVALAKEGKLANRVLTEKGWYIPDAAKPQE